MERRGVGGGDGSARRSFKKQHQVLDEPGHYQF